MPIAPDLPEPIIVPPPPQVTPYLPFPTLPALRLDEANNGLGLAQQITRTRNLQGRVLWVDATANLDSVNTSEKITSLVGKVASAGFNTLVFDVKPIIGQTLYPSQYAPKMTRWVRPWKTQTLPIEFDPLREMVTQAKAKGLGLIVSMNVFSEGHREFPGQGPGDANPDWQTVLYEPSLTLRPDTPTGTPAVTPFPIHNRANGAPSDPSYLSLYTDSSKLKPLPNALVALVDRDGVVQAVVSGGAVATLGARISDGGAAIVGEAAQAVDYLRKNALPGTRLTIDNQPAYVRISELSERQVPLMTNPHSTVVRQRILNMLTEIATRYEVNGFIFDDRLRYASLNADFSEETRQQFQAYVQKPLRWPDDVFRYEVDFPSLNRREVPGPYYDAWLTFRALNLRNFLAEIVRTVKSIRPDLTVSTYVGSWYPDYPDLGANWGADDLTAGFRFLNDAYRRTGWAGLVDFTVTGAYYETASLVEAAEKGINIGETVEAAGQFSNRAVNDETFVYAGLQLDKFTGKPDLLKRALQAAAATTQGIMVFDYSHNIDQFWPLFTEAFQKPAVAPHAVPGLVNELRQQHAADRASGKPQPAVILYRGASGTGF